ncbi:MAG: hypothetical protein IPK58_10450 [Acidobacteria bacterium]|nr:hypothetical protein [Acidobacteriota bacterium]
MGIGIWEFGFWMWDSRFEDSKIPRIPRIPRIPDSRIPDSGFQIPDCKVRDSRDSRSEFKIPGFRGFQTGNPESRCKRVESVPSAVVDGWLRHSRTEVLIPTNLQPSAAEAVLKAGACQYHLR